MKKTLSILLSLLMVLGTITCIFTVPVATASAEEAQPVVETLPVTDFVSTSVAKTITPTTNILINGYTFSLSQNFGIRGWEGTSRNVTVDGVKKYYDATIIIDGDSFEYKNPETEEYEVKSYENDKHYAHDEAGNYYNVKNGTPVKVKDPWDSRISPQVLYQMTVDVTVSDDINEGVKLHPVFHSNDSVNWAFDKFVGVRNEVGSTVTETAYNYAKITPSSDKHVSSLTAENSAALVKGKTYTYTYLFAIGAGAAYINHISFAAEGLTEGKVTVGVPKIFAHDDTYASNFFIKEDTNTKKAHVIYFAVEEDGNVFTRMYAYHDIGDTTMAKRVVSAKVGGELYNIEFKGGTKYELSFDVRYTREEGFNDTTGRSPAFDFFETGELDYTSDYADVKDETDTFNFKQADSFVNKQREYSGPNNGYSYFYAGATSATQSRRIKSNVAYMAYYNADGTTIGNKTQGFGSQSGRNYKNEINTSTWIKGTYTLNAMGAQTLQEAAIAGAANNKNNNNYMRYIYADGKWTWNNSNYKSFYASAKQDVTVALGMEYLYTGATYDFDNFKLSSNIVTVPTEYVNAAGDVVNVNYTSHPATKYYDVLAGKTNASIKLFESDIYTFKGWYDGDTLIATDTDVVVEGDCDDLKAVVITADNILTNAGGFENYNAGTGLEDTFVEVSAGCTKYPNYTGGTFRYYTDVPPTGDKWIGWDTNTNLNTLKDSDNGETKAQIVADIKAANGKINTGGATAYTHFNPHASVVSKATVPTYKDCGNYAGQGNKVSVEVLPYSGDKMLKLQASSRSSYRALEGLTAGKGYTVSMYVYNPYKDYFLKDICIVDNPYGHAGADSNASLNRNRLAFYQEPYSSTTETYLNANGAVATKSGVQRPTNPDHIGKWFKVELTFIATANVAYIGFANQYAVNSGAFVLIDEFNMVEYQCNGNHIYDDIADAECNLCGEARVYPSAWDFEDGTTENVTVRGNSKLEVVDAVDQPAKLGSKYLQYTSAHFDGMAFNFDYKQGYKYTISYDFKIFTYGDGIASGLKNPNGIDHNINKYDDGLFGATGKYGMVDKETYGDGNQSDEIRKIAATALNPAKDNLITRYYENGLTYQKVAAFSHSGQGENNFAGRAGKDGVFIDSMGDAHGGKIWNEWQHVVIEIGTNNDYEGIVEFGIRPNDSGWVVGIDNVKVEKVSLTTINEVDDATNGTESFAIRARTVDKKQGLRFKSTINLDKLNLADGAKIVEYGTLAMQAARLNEGFHLVREAAKDKAYAGHAVAGVAYSEADGIDVRFALDEATNTLTYTGVLTGIGVANYEVDFAVRGYAIVQLADGTRTTVYDDVKVLSVYAAAQQIIEKNNNATDVAVAQTVVENYEAYLASK